MFMTIDDYFSARVRLAHSSHLIVFHLRLFIFLFRHTFLLLSLSSHHHHPPNKAHPTHFPLLLFHFHCLTLPVQLDSPINSLYGRRRKSSHAKRVLMERRRRTNAKDNFSFPKWNCFFAARTVEMIKVCTRRKLPKKLWLAFHAFVEMCKWRKCIKWRIDLLKTT